MQIDFYNEVQKLNQDGQPFVVATVVGAEKTTSAKTGAKVIIASGGVVFEE